MKFSVSTLANIILGTGLLTSIFLVSAIPSSSVGEYDPWCDLDDDGDIDIFDVVRMAGRYGTSGVPINKTALLLDLQDRVAALETRIPKRDYLSVPAAAFVPCATTVDWRNLGTTLRNYDTAGWAYFYTAVYLPQGVIVRNLTSHWYDASTDDYVSCWLLRFNQTTGQFMAAADSTDTGGLGSSYDETISYATVDNTQYAYLLNVNVPESATQDYYFQYAIIDFEYPS